MDKVIIRDLLTRGIIGINDWEREQPQDILINIVILTDTRKVAQTDDIADCVDYRALAKLVRQHAETAKRLTVEALANDLSEICLKQPGVQSATVRVEKPGAVRFAASVGVEVERSRDDA
ncbi:MAG TPA: dihydroneopterin aldolase [Anaerolineales bacterium]|nr:dihydroneopterin aldolase [Anaerolineales bacterium]